MITLTINPNGERKVVKLIEAIEIIEEIDLKQRIEESDTYYYKNRESVLNYKEKNRKANSQNTIPKNLKI